MSQKNISGFLEGSPTALEEVMRTVLCSRLSPRSNQSYCICQILFDLGVKGKSCFFRSQWSYKGIALLPWLCRICFLPGLLPLMKEKWLLNKQEKQICMKNSLMPLHSFDSGLGHPEWNIQKLSWKKTKIIIQHSPCFFWFGYCKSTSIKHLINSLFAFILAYKKFQD